VDRFFFCGFISAMMNVCYLNEPNLCTILGYRIKEQDDHMTLCTSLRETLVTVRSRDHYFACHIFSRLLVTTSSIAEITAVPPQVPVLIPSNSLRTKPNGSLRMTST
jgi:hypothetical protein